MARPLDNPRRILVVRYLLSKHDPKDIAAECNCAITTVYRIQRNLLKYGSAGKPKLVKTGRPNRFNDASEQHLKEFIARRPGADQGEIVKYMDEIHGVKVSRSTISRMLRKFRSSGKERSGTQKKKGEGNGASIQEVISGLEGMDDGEGVLDPALQDVVVDQMQALADAAREDVDDEDVEEEREDAQDESFANHDPALLHEGRNLSHADRNLYSNLDLPDQSIARPP